MVETELKVILKAKDLAEHTLRVTSDVRWYGSLHYRNTWNFQIWKIHG